MGLFDRKDDTTPENAEPDGPLESLANAFVGRIVDAGIKGPGPMASSHHVAQKALKESGGDVRKAVDEIVSDHVKKASAGGFVTGVGGLVTMPVSLPANVLASTCWPPGWWPPSPSCAGMT
ncbi:hypothetical protein [Ornithinimicrobium sp. CNJ-824]|uniref:hypothetical protein n=1 Tax=Ornithinimicrobium sp. CNJ-824 TaxID=1904966 RepID=UPI001EDB6491|nr:hypothetical protein [Ornithinimicrobium sp. CNJ-824]